MSLFLQLAAEVPSLKLPMGLVIDVVGSHWPLVLGLVVFASATAIFKLPRIKGFLGEWVVRRALSRLNPDRYHVLHNVFVPSRSGEGAMTEIDHVIVSGSGIFVIETKHYSGWIYGSPGDSRWTRTNFRHKQSFLNPLKQNQGHINALAFFLDLPRSMFHSIVCFTGDATLKTPMPPHVITTGLRNHIESREGTLLEPVEVVRAWQRLKSHDEGMVKSVVRSQHVARLAAVTRG